MARVKKITAKSIEDNDVRVKQRYVKGYLQVVQNLYSRGAFSEQQAKLAERAFQRRLPPSGFVTLLRSEDPQYVRTHDFRKRSDEAKGAWNAMRPGRPMPQEFSARYVRSNMTPQQLFEKVRSSVTTRGETPSFGTGMANQQAYRQMRELLNTSFRNVHGSDAHPALHDMLFSTKLNEQMIGERIPELFGGKEVFAWLDPKEKTKEMKQAFTPPTLSSDLMGSGKFGIDVQNRK